MIIALIVAFLAFVIVYFLVSVARDRARAMKALEDPPAHMQAVDLEAFRNLIDPEEEKFLRSNLQSSDFRKIQRERLWAAIGYITAARQNAGILLRLAEAARESKEPATAQAAEMLMENAIRLRLYAANATVRLYLAMFLPGIGGSAIRVADRYEQMTRQVVMLGLQYPTRGISGAL